MLSNSLPDSREQRDLSEAGGETLVSGYCCSLSRRRMGRGGERGGAGVQDEFWR